jgi:hypothetical protein
MSARFASFVCILASLLLAPACDIVPRHPVDPIDPNGTDDPNGSADPDITVEGGVLRIGAAGDGARITIRRDTEGLRVEVDGAETVIVEPVDAIEVHAGDGDDVVRYEQRVVADVDLTVVTGDGDDEVIVRIEPAGEGEEMAVRVRVDTGAGADITDFRFDGTAVPALNAYAALTANGTAFVPEVGDEIVVAFLAGDPDRPIIIGGVYNPSRSVEPDGGDRRLDFIVDVDGARVDLEVKAQGGDGPDLLELSFTDSGAALDAVHIDVDARLGGGDNRFDSQLFTGAPEATAFVRIEAEDGDHVIHVEDDREGAGTFAYDLDLGVGAVVRGTSTLRHNGANANAPPGSQLAPSQTKVICHGAAASVDIQARLPARTDGGGGGDGGETGRMRVQAAALASGRLEFLRLLDVGTSPGAAAEEAELQVSDLVAGGTIDVTVQPRGAVDRAVYLQDRVALAGGAAMTVALEGDAGPDALLAHVTGLSTQAGAFDLSADGGDGDDVIAVLVRDVDLGDDGEAAFEVRGGDGTTFLALSPPPETTRTDPAEYRINGEAGVATCYAADVVAATGCERREGIGDELHRLLDGRFGEDRTDAWREDG